LLEARCVITHAVGVRGAAAPTREAGTGAPSGTDVNRHYGAKYSGGFVRRYASLKGAQIWDHGGKNITRACSGTTKRPLRAFLSCEWK